MLSARDVTMAHARLRALGESWNEVQPQARVRSTAERLLRVHPLRAANALQLAAALEAIDRDRSPIPFVCLDQRLSDAASREGLTVVSG